MIKGQSLETQQTLLAVTSLLRLPWESAMPFLKFPTTPKLRVTCTSAIQDMKVSTTNYATGRFENNGPAGPTYSE